MPSHFQFFRHIAFAVKLIGQRASIFNTTFDAEKRQRRSEPEQKTEYHCIKLCNTAKRMTRKLDFCKIFGCCFILSRSLFRLETSMLWIYLWNIIDVCVCVRIKSLWSYILHIESVRAYSTYTFLYIYFISHFVHFICLCYFLQCVSGAAVVFKSNAVLFFFCIFGISFPFICLADFFLGFH